MALAKFINSELALFPEWAVKCGLGPMLPGQPTSRSSLLDYPNAIFFAESLEEGQTKEKMTEICGWKKVLTAPTLLEMDENRVIRDFGLREYPTRFL
jgi:hypothetical protein